ncbi:MAG: carbohydrate kinase family protein [Candidatus Woesearchaeota archaeon]
MYDVITLGSGTVDVFVKTQKPEIMRHKGHDDVCYAIGQKILVEDLHVDTGGGGTNTAVAFSRLGLKTGWIGEVGTDLHAKTVLDEMKREKVDFLGGRGRGMTGYSVILTGLEHDRSILAFKGVNDKLAAYEVPWKKLKTKWFYFSAMMNQSFETLKKAALFAKRKGIKYAFNPSMYIAKMGAKALKPIIDGCDLLIMNKEEAQALTGMKEAGCKQLLAELQKHAKIAVITDGPKPAHAYNGIQHFQLIPPKIRVVETTGAGDAFASGMLAGIIIKQDIKEAMQWGMAEAEAVIQQIGAKQSLLTRRQIEKVKKAKVIVTRL